MSSVVSGITKVFSSIGTGLATLGTAVKGVGASFFSAGGSSAGSLFSSAAGSTSTLGNIFSGVKNIMSIGPLGAIGDALGATAGALAGGAGATTGAGTGFLSGLGSAFSNPQVVAGVFQGAGVGIGKYLEMEAYENMQQENIEAAERAQAVKTANYNNLPVFESPQAIVPAPPEVQTAAAEPITAQNAYARYNETKEAEVWAYNPETGMVEKMKRSPAPATMVA